MATYKVKQGAYHEIYENREVILPDGFELITGGENDLGEAKHDGFFHWLGCLPRDEFESREKEFNGFNVTPSFEFGPLVFITINDTQFYEDYPYLISAEEFNKKWQFSNYRIAEFSENFYLKNMIQILKIESEFKIECLEVTNRDYFDYGEFKKLEHHYGVSLYEILRERKSTIHVSDNNIALDYWNKLISEVIISFGATISHKDVNINAAHDVVAKVPRDADQFFDELRENAEAWTLAYQKAQRLMDFKEIELLG